MDTSLPAFAKSPPKKQPIGPAPIIIIIVYPLIEAYRGIIENYINYKIK
jgi:hypothetical protein